MSLYFKNCKTELEYKNMYKKLILKYHPDVSKRNTTKEFLQIRNEYNNLSKNNFIQIEDERKEYKKCNIDLIIDKQIQCGCGNYYEIINLKENTIECDFCSLFISID